MKHFQAGRYVQQPHYKSFQPNPINRAWVVDDMALLQLLGQADRELGRLDMYSEYIPNIDLFIRMHVLKEANQSSRIEGTQTTMEEALLEKEDVALDRRDDWEEVQNYVAAMNEAVDKLQKLPFTARLVRETHKTLMQGVRGKGKRPGEFRRSQNWIGGASIDDAVFVPPMHDSVGQLIGDIEKFVNNDRQHFPELLKIALVHYQFETIHPFLDGNGRAGRLLIALYLVSRGILKQPVLYLSDFFERNRQLYYDNLMRVREKNDLLQWFRFFLVGVIETAKSSTATFDNILKLQKKVESQLQTLGSRTANAQKVMNTLYQRPVINAARVGKAAGVSPASAYKLIADLEKFGILKEITGGKRGKIYAFNAYLKLFK
ncbi:MAG: Fic family protein [Sulfuricaulis sp.]|uniref:Fic family protein n=1 Tax=Sulfuricaulis sp. TaxID=2003553 RepID=UPI0025D9E133|nr:Fic family protein [Sulfuricaulis sp.]MCR4345964.1 Fic family protein [Sulfuricaulis sp.]